MRIFYVNVIEQNAGWGAEWFVNQAFKFLGHTTYCVDYRKNRNNLYQVVKKIPPCDVFLLQRGDHFPITLIKALKIPKFFWASELVSRRRDQDRLLKSFLFEHVFFRTYECIDTVVKKGWIKRNNCSILLSGFDKTIFKPSNILEKDIDILFVGTLTNRRKSILEQINKYYKVELFSAYGDRMASLFNRAKIVLNIHAEEFRDTETRVYEALGCGAFLLTEKLSEENPFVKNELVEFEDVEDCLAKIDFYLKNSEIREHIAYQGYIEAVNNHTYIHRAKDLLGVIEKYVMRDSLENENFRKDILIGYKAIEILSRRIVPTSKKFLALLHKTVN